MTSGGRLSAAGLGIATFVAVLGLGIAAMPGAEVEAEPPAPAGALSHVAKINAEANVAAAQRVRREGGSAL